MASDPSCSVDIKPKTESMGRIHDEILLPNSDVTDATHSAVPNHPNSTNDIAATEGAIKPISLIDVDENYHNKQYKLAPCQTPVDTPITPNQANTIDNTEYMPHKWTKLFTSFSFLSRIVLFLFSLFVLALSICYCIAQLVSVELDLITQCPERKTLEQIWAHSYNASVKNNGKLDALADEYQYGLTSDECWSTKSIQINTGRLWYSNYYAHKWHNKINWKCVLFGLISLYCLCIIIFNIVTIVSNIIDVARNTLHTKSKWYKLETTKNTSKWKDKMTKYKTVFDEYFGTDSSAWVIRIFVMEAMEIALQTNALFIYNGFNPNHKDDVYLAEKSQFITLFALCLAINCFGSAILWLSYAFATRYCYGLVFKVALFCVDQLCDVFYSLFPFMVILYDDYNQNARGFVTLLGQLSTESTLTTFASGVPLVLLCNKCLTLIIGTKNEISNDWYFEWDSNLVAQEAPLTLTNTDDADRTANVHISRNSNRRKSSSNWAGETGKKRCIKRCVLVAIAAVYISYGIFLQYMIPKRINDSIAHCQSIQETNYYVNGSLIDNLTLSQQELNLLQSNPELFLWNHCLYKVYPFVNNPLVDEERYGCQCRVMVIESWNDKENKLTSTSVDRKTHFNLTQQQLLSHMLQHWTMLEKFQSVDSESSFSEEYTFLPSMVTAPFLKAFEWQFAVIELPSNVYWPSLNYLNFEETSMEQQLPLNLHELTKLKYISLKFTQLQAFPQGICNLTQLEVLEMEHNYISEIPHCVGDLTSLKVFTMDVTLYLKNVPLSIFSLPDLYWLSLFKGDINYLDLLLYNLPHIDPNDTGAVNDWFDANFDWNGNQTDYYLQFNSICEEVTDAFPNKWKQFIQSVAKCDYECTYFVLDEGESRNSRIDNLFCLPSRLGDGRCDKFCNDPRCAYDKGDCVQLCFAEEYTNCTWDLFTNNVCDAGCDNEYCQAYKWKSDFVSRLTIERNNSEYSADLHSCARLNDTYFGNITVNTCEGVQGSSYLDIDAYYVDGKKYLIQCRLHYIGDGFCDDACRIEGCGYDEDDCSLGCINDICSQIYIAWQFFVSADTYLVSHTVVCEDWGPIAVELFGNEFNYTKEFCYQLTIITDHNHDGYMNFREFGHFGYILIEGNTRLSKPTQINCSTCVGMENYNVFHESDDDSGMTISTSVFVNYDTNTTETDDTHMNTGMGMLWKLTLLFLSLLY
eukprot:138820_1